MPTLDWIGKQAVVNHDKDVPFRLLKHDPKLSVGDSQNLLIKGDNLEALKALMPYYVGKVKCVYIDPPYNTGNESWQYNDNVNSPEIRKWLRDRTGVDADDLTRHDKWICMMYPRLKLLRELLSEDGVILISIDDNEALHLRHILNELFGENNFVANFIWNHRKSSQNDIDVSLSHNYTYCFAKNRNVFKLNSLPIDKSKFLNPNNDPRGAWVADPFDAPGIRENLSYEIINPLTRQKFIPPPGRHWRFTQDKYLAALKEQRVLFGKTGKSKPQYKRYLSEAEEKGTNTSTIWDDLGTATEGTKELMNIFDGRKVFDTPKPVSLITRILMLCSHKNSIILDSFAGSGTTGHAVLELNKQDGGKRKFVMVEMENSIAEKITAERLRRVIGGYRGNDGLGGGFQFMRLDTTLFDKDGKLSNPVTYLDLARYVFFTETQRDLDEKKVKKPYIGTCGETEYFLFFTERGKNTFKREQLKQMSKNNQGTAKVVYADRCLLSEETLQKHNVVFKQIPYQVKLY